MDSAADQTVDSVADQTVHSAADAAVDSAVGSENNKFKPLNNILILQMFKVGNISVTAFL